MNAATVARARSMVNCPATWALSIPPRPVTVNSVAPTRIWSMISRFLKTSTIAVVCAR